MAYADYSKLKVLIVDDFDNFRMAVSKMLQEYGARDVDTVSNGRQALQLCSENRYDLILCDYNLGTGKNGQQVLEELRHRRLLPPQCLFVRSEEHTAELQSRGHLVCRLLLDEKKI